MPPPAEGEGYSTGRGGAANVHPQGHTNGVSKDDKKYDGPVARVGLAYPFSDYECTHIVVGIN
jgi:hypothetical protein